MKNKPKQLINYKGTDITINELAIIAGKTYGTMASRINRNPDLNGEQIIAKKTRKEATYKGHTKSMIEWAEELNISIGTLRKKAYEESNEKAIAFYVENKHLIPKRKRYKAKNKKIDDADITALEFNPELHAQRLLDAGLSYIQVAARIKQAGLLS